MAKKVSLYSVKVGNGYESDDIMLSKFLMAMAFVVNDSQTRNCPNGTVANMSWRISHSHAINDLAKALLSAGTFVAVGAGNEATNTEGISPATEPSLCTVGATDNSNQLAWFSNYGPAVDILAPGVDVLSASSKGRNASVSHTQTDHSLDYVMIRVEEALF